MCVESEPMIKRANDTEKANRMKGWKSRYIIQGRKKKTVIDIFMFHINLMNDHFILLRQLADWNIDGNCRSKYRMSNIYDNNYIIYVKVIEMNLM